MTVESLLKVIEEGMTVILKTEKNRIIVQFECGNDIEAFSCGFLYRKTRKHAILNEAETRKRFPLLSVSSEEELIETKEERRLRRNIRAQMAIENSRKEELGL